MEKLEFAQKIKTCEQLALSCYMKRGPSLPWFLMLVISGTFMALCGYNIF